MSLPSSSLQSTLTLSDPRCGAQVLFYFYVFWVVLGFVPWLENFGRWDRKLVTSSSMEVRMGKC